MSKNPAEDRDPVKHLMAVERAWDEGRTTTDFDRLVAAGVRLPPPQDLTDDELPSKLAEIIEVLARERTFLDHTDHLSDRQLYEYLWTESLKEEIPDVEPFPLGATIVDPTVNGSDEAIRAYLKYYADEEARAHWKEINSAYDMPEHEDPPYDRDQYLPGPWDHVMN